MKILPIRRNRSPDEDNLDPISTPELGDTYIYAKVLGGVIHRGKVITHKCNTDDYMIGRAHDKPILETHVLMMLGLWMIRLLN